MSDKKKIDPNDLLKRINGVTGGSTPKPAANQETPSKKTGDNAINVGKVGKDIAEGAGAMKDEAIDQVREGYTKGVEAIETARTAFWTRSWVGRFVAWANRTRKKLWDATSVKKYNGKYAKFADPVAEDASAGDKLKHKLGRFGLACARGLRRTGRVALVTALVATGINLIPESIGGDHVRSFTTEPVYDGTRMAVFGIHTDTLYINSYSEIDHEKELFTIKGNASPTEGNDATARMLKVQPRMAHNLWNFAHGKGIFMPDREVTSIIPGGNYPYAVTHYGSRWKLTRLFGLRAYPEVLSIERLDPATVPGAKPRVDATQSKATSAFLDAAVKSEKNDTKENTVTAQALAGIRVKPEVAKAGM